MHQDVAQSEPISTLESRGFFPKEPEGEAEKVQETTDKNKLSIISSGGTKKSKGSTASLLTQQYMLLKREMNMLTRSPGPMIANVCITALLALIFGVIFYGVGRQDRTDLLVSKIMLSRMLAGSSSTGQTTHRFLFFVEFYFFHIHTTGRSSTVGRGSQCFNECYDGAKSNCLDYFLLGTTRFSERVRHQSLHNPAVLFIQACCGSLAVLRRHGSTGFDCLFYDRNSNEFLHLLSPFLCTCADDYGSLRAPRKLLHRQ
jgi:hypothetical protein